MILCRQYLFVRIRRFTNFIELAYKILSELYFYRTAKFIIIPFFRFINFTFLLSCNAFFEGLNRLNQTKIDHHI